MSGGPRKECRAHTLSKKRVRPQSREKKRKGRGRSEKKERADRSVPGRARLWTVGRPLRTTSTKVGSVSPGASITLDEHGKKRGGTARLESGGNHSFDGAMIRRSSCSPSKRAFPATAGASIMSTREGRRPASPAALMPKATRRRRASCG